MHAIKLSPRRRPGPLWAGAILALTGLGAVADGAPLPSDAFPNFESYIKISGYAPFIDGDSAAFANRTSTPTAGAGGIEDFYYTQDVSRNDTLTVNGRALAGSDDYLAHVNLTNFNLGSIDAGYQRFRTFYDGVGGFFPLSDTFQALSDENLHVDRGAFWATLTIARPDQPVFKVTFRDETRNGQKDSTEWAAVINPNAIVVNGALVGTAAPANTPFIAPNVQNLDEHHRILEGSMTGTFGHTTELFKITGDWVNNNDWRSYVKYPGSTVTADPAVSVLDDQELYHANTLRLLNQAVTKFNEHISLEVGLTYAHVDTDIGGNWVTPAYSSALNTVYNVVTAGNIHGGARVDDYVGNIFLHLKPAQNWSADIGFRDETNVTSASGGFTTTSLSSKAKNTTDSSSYTVAQDVTYSHYVDHIHTPEVTLEYLGLGNATLYGTFDDRIDHGDQHWVNPFAATTTAALTGAVTTATAPLGSIFYQDADQNNRDFQIGANWNVSSQLTVRTEVYRKDHQNNFIGADDYVGTASYGALYATGYTFTGYKFSMIYRPVPQLSFNTRYQPQTGTMTVTANTVNGGLGDETTSGRVRGQMISETVDWTPNRAVYFQANVNVAYNYLQTAYPAVVVSTTAPAPSPIQNSNNNYITGSALCGFVLGKLDDVQIQGYLTRADDYNPQVATGGQPYGAGFKEQSLTVGLKHKISDKWLGEAKVGYLDRTSDTTGGFTNYHGPLAYLSVEYGL